MIGILAGMGPKSTGPFIDQVISQYQLVTGAKNDLDFPPIMIYSLPTPFYVDRPIDHKLMEKTVCEGLKKLELCGVSFVAIPCNTVHLYFKTLQRFIRVPLLNMIDETLRAIPSSAKKLSILGTRPTIDSQIFQKRFEEAGLKYELPQQEKVDALILSIKDDRKHSLNLWKNLSKEFLSEGIDTVLLACTDLNVFFKEIQMPFQMIDSSICLAKAIVSRWIELKK